MNGGGGPGQPGAPGPPSRPGTGLEQVGAQLRALTDAKDRLQGLLDAVLAISRELDLSVVLRRIVTTAMELVGARYGALGVLHESGEYLRELITAGLSEDERAALAGVDFPHGEGVLGHLIRHPRPLRVGDIPSHPASVGFPPGHPRMRTLLGVAISVRGEIYGDLYLSERHDGRPFDRHDEDIVVALAGAAGVAIENARLFAQVRDSAETFQRLLLPTLSDLSPFTAATVYRPAAEPNRLGGDWYDALVLPDGSVGVMIGDVGGHDLRAAAAMAQARSMLRALFYDRRTPPSEVLTQLDHTLHATTDIPVTTACLARVEPGESGWVLRWSTAGHFPPLLIGPGAETEYLYAEPGLPLGVSTGEHRPDHTRPLPPGSVLVFFTDGLVEHPARPLDENLTALAGLAASLVSRPLQEFVQALADRHPSDGHDDMAVLALRVPLGPGPPPGAATAGRSR
ncbi:PP2C family protein-serine/threonine phosphatase [Streptomyces sp. SLBN-134]|uniref:PP2C family protein-serine/threonine phosphatase n=1 Tax=Streptomyces sp. SLBN-134 TaxID=2768456 RepID=UPI001166B13A|nr:GAF domain-containing SpoIIE family protein phosphatase [Streptomyces sp. SLBN-134]TQL24574.1 GAF domain-containing protein [Streptomyces sp. SLBN-134]